MSQEKQIFSDGFGNAFHTEEELIAHEEGIETPQDVNLPPREDPLAGLPKHKVASEIPESLYGIFNKILEYKRDNLTYQYREVPELEYVNFGIDPFLIEAYRALADENPDLSKKLNEYNNADPEDLNRMIAEQNRIRNEILVYSLISVTDENGIVYEFQKDDISSLNGKLKEELYQAITEGGTAEREAVQRFLIDAATAYSDNLPQSS